ncbi:MAG: DUF3500 domain-containing protein [Planctomycetes bacterium]|nr:DUF3500 domain-containing protein [Planctomycetota bacterium]
MQMFKPSNRRKFLQHAAGSAVAAAVVGPTFAGQPKPGGQDGPSTVPIRAFYRTLTADQRKMMCFEWDHRGFTELPLRLHVTNNWDISRTSISSFTPEQQRLIDDVIGSVMNPGWPERLKQQARDDTGRAWGDQKIAIFGTPDKGPCQCVITGFHLTLRASCERLPAVAFHGALCHGHQPSGFNERVGHPDNIFWYQAVLANRVFMALDEKQRAQALVTRGMPYYEFDGRIDRQVIRPDTKLERPLEPDVRFRGPDATFPGMPIRDMTRDQKAVVRQALTGLLEPYRPEYREQVHDCLTRQGGLDRCSMAFYQEHDLGNDREWDNWRIEGPAFVWYFRGFPHVHIWIHVANNPATPVTSHFG